MTFENHHALATTERTSLEAILTHYCRKRCPEHLHDRVQLTLWIKPLLAEVDKDPAGRQAHRHFLGMKTKLEKHTNVWYPPSRAKDTILMQEE